MNTAKHLGPAQLAFVRAWAEGIDPVIAWERFMFLQGAGDVRRARGELLGILEELRRLARLHGRPDLAALLVRDPESIVERDGRTLSLEDFRRQFDEDFFTEAELLEQYAQQVGKPNSRSSARRRQRLRERLLAAIQWLQEKSVRPPLPADELGIWLDAPVAARLQAAGLRSLSDLHFWVSNRGFNWHRSIPRLGPEGAGPIVRWLRENEGTLGALPSLALQPRNLVATETLTVAPRTGIVPIERFLAPSDERSGEHGLNRAPKVRCKLQANNDFEAIQAWLRLRLPGSHTWRSYRKEAERFLLWAVVERRKALSSLDGDDCVAYRDFLASPGAAWVGPRNAQRWSEAWRPFEGPLSSRSQVTALTIVRSLCEWLVRRHYLDSNPWDDVPQRADAPSMPSLRALSQRQWELVQAWLANEAPSPALARLRFLVGFAYLTGMRLAELAAARLGWFRHESLDDGVNGDEMAWSIMVLGKRNKWREVPLPDAAMDLLGAYLDQRGLSPNPLENDAQAPLLAKLDGGEPLTTARIYDVLEKAFADCAAAVYPKDKRSAERIREASTHWLRHTYGSHAVARGVPPDVVQANLGHESLATTSIYVRAEKGRRHRAVKAAFANP